MLCETVEFVLTVEFSAKPGITDGCHTQTSIVDDSPWTCEDDANRLAPLDCLLQEATTTTHRERILCNTRGLSSTKAHFT